MMDPVIPSLWVASSEAAVFRFFGRTARREGADAFAGRSGRAAAKGGRSRRGADGFIASTVDGRSGQICCTGFLNQFLPYNPKIATIFGLCKSMFHFTTDQESSRF